MSDPFEEWKSARGKEPIPSSIPAGTEIGEYKVLGLIGRGGSAEVYSAAHVKLGATVAIKILHKLTEQSRIRFDREAKILSGTTHPCFPQFKSYGEFEGRPYIVTELLGPCELPRTDKEVAEFLLKVLDGVGCLHRLGFVHRDIRRPCRRDAGGRVFRRKAAALLAADHRPGDKLAPRDTLSVGGRNGAGHQAAQMARTSCGRSRAGCGCRHSGNHGASTCR